MHKPVIKYVPDTLQKYTFLGGNSGLNTALRKKTMLIQIYLHENI